MSKRSHRLASCTSTPSGTFYKFEYASKCTSNPIPIAERVPRTSVSGNRPVPSIEIQNITATGVAPGPPARGQAASSRAHCNTLWRPGRNCAACRRHAAWSACPWQPDHPPSGQPDEYVCLTRGEEHGATCPAFCPTHFAQIQQIAQRHTDSIRPVAQRQHQVLPGSLLGLDPKTWIQSRSGWSWVPWYSARPPKQQSWYSIKSNSFLQLEPKWRRMLKHLFV